VKAKQIVFWALILVFIISGLFLFSCSINAEGKREGFVYRPPSDQELRENAMRMGYF
jgi:hypothetical protein